MLLYGICPKVASERLGHSSIGITMDLYSPVTADKIENCIFSRLSAFNN